MTVSRRAFALGTAAMAAVAALPAYAQSNLSAEDRAVLARAQSYLQNLTSAQGTFVETSGARAGCASNTPIPPACWSFRTART